MHCHQNWVGNQQEFPHCFPWMPNISSLVSLTSRLHHPSQECDSFSSLLVSCSTAKHEWDSCSVPQKHFLLNPGQPDTQSLIYTDRKNKFSKYITGSDGEQSYSCLHCSTPRPMYVFYLFETYDLIIDTHVGQILHPGKRCIAWPSIISKLARHLHIRKPNECVRWTASECLRHLLTLLP